MIRALIVDDSAVVRKLLRKILESDPEIEVVGEASDGRVALERVSELRPDIVTMDIQMPVMDGFEATRRLMAESPLPIVIVSSSYRPSDVDMTFRALNAGALTALQKPPGPADPNHERLARELVRTVKLMSEIMVVRRTSDRRPLVSPPPSKAAPRPDVRVVAVGASTGGPPALRQLLDELSPDLAAPVLVVQHMAAGFTCGMVDWLDRTSRLRVTLAKDGEHALPGCCYVAPEGVHLKIAADGRLILDASPPRGHLCPSVGELFLSAAQHYGRQALGVLLTGMGRDGAAELKLMKDKGAITICQDRESSVVHGMPGEAVRLGGATHVLPMDQIAAMINTYATPSKEPS